MRTLLLELRPAALLETRLDDLLRQLGEAASGRVGIPVTVQIEGEIGLHQTALPPDVHIALYRITQEALNNVIKHARAHQAVVRLCWAGVPPINLEAPVRYLSAEEGGVSHFKYLRDNALLTWMHTRLFLGFVLRLPMLLWRRLSATGTH